MLTLKKKPVTIYFEELKYLMYQKMAEEQGSKAAELIRNAMDEYLVNHASNHDSLNDWEPISLGGLKDGGDWVDGDFRDAMLGASF